MIADLVSDLAKSAFAVRDRLPVSDWCEENVVLTAGSTPGRLSLDPTPYAREWLDVFGDPEIREITLCTSTQISKTETVMNCLRWAVAQDPGPMLFVFPSEALARSFSQQRLRPSLVACKGLRDFLPKRDWDFKNLDITFANCSLILVGAHSPGNLASRPIRYLFLDEIDKYPPAKAREASAVDLARERTNSFWNRKEVLTSTPTIETGAIWKSLLAGDFRLYYVPCPHCGQYQSLEFPRIRWPEQSRNKEGYWNLVDIRSKTYYECAFCRKAINQTEKRRILEEGQWRPTKESLPERRSYHLNALYSPWISWGDLAIEFLESKDSIGGLQHFNNSKLALPWKQGAEELTVSKLREHCGTYSRGGPIPFEPLGIKVAVDVQREEYYYIVAAFSKSLDIYVVDYGVISELEGLEALAESQYDWVDGKKKGTAKVTGGVIDSSAFTVKIYDFCLARRNSWVPVKGGSLQSKLITYTDTEYYSRLKRRQVGLRLLRFNDHVFKTDLYIRKLQDREGSKVFFPKDVTPDFLVQLTQEQFISQYSRSGVLKHAWVHSSKAMNHFGDCLKMMLIFLVRNYGRKM